MSLIIAYIGKKGCVMAADKRKIGYFGDKKNLETLEEETVVVSTKLKLDRVYNLSDGRRVFVEGKYVQSGDFVNVNGVKYKVK